MLNPRTPRTSTSRAPPIITYPPRACTPPIRNREPCGCVGAQRCGREERCGGSGFAKAYNGVLDSEIRNARDPSSRVVDNTIANTLPCTLGILYFQSLPYFTLFFQYTTLFVGPQVNGSLWVSVWRRRAKVLHRRAPRDSTQVARGGKGRVLSRFDTTATCRW